MKLNRGYAEDRNEADERLNTQEVVQVGKMTTDGHIYAGSEATLFAKKSVKVSQTTATAVEILALPTDLNIAAADLYAYFIEVYAVISIEGDAVATDDMVINVMDGATQTQQETITDYGSYPVTKSLPAGSQPVKFFLRTTNTSITVDAADWAAAETHTSYFTVLVYRYPLSICSES